MAKIKRFHGRTGRLVVLMDEATRAERCYAQDEFNNGMVFSEGTLRPDELFCVKMNKKISTWSGSIEIGFTSADPSEGEISKSAMKANLSFISGARVIVNGIIVKEHYCADLNTLNVGDVIGIVRNFENEVHLFVNGADQGVATICQDVDIWAMVNLYGKCSSISIASDDLVGSDRLVERRSFSERLFDSSLASHTMPPIESYPIDVSQSPAASLHRQQSSSNYGEILTFYSKCGSLVRLSTHGDMAIRAHHQDEFNNGVVMTNRTLKDDELFEIRINSLTNRWSGSIEMGVTTHAPDLLEIPSTMTNLRSGTVMLSGCSIITNGKSTRKQYLDFHLDELKVGDYVGLMKKSQGTLHFFINGIDQGVAANDIPPDVYGVVDLYGRAVGVSIVPHHSFLGRNCRNTAIADRISRDRYWCKVEMQAFSSVCGKNIELSSCQTTAMRKDPLEDFNHAVVLSSHPLKPGELFSVCIANMVPKWSGSLEIGVTTYSPERFDFPATMTDVHSGTWIMTTTGVMIDGTTVIDDYGSDIDSLTIGDTLGVCRNHNGNLHFYVNGIDQGIAASGVPVNIYAVADLYGQVSEVHILDIEMDGQCKSSDTVVISASLGNDHTEEINFDRKRVQSTALSDGRIVVNRKDPEFSFDTSVVIVNSKLKIGRLYEFEVNKIVHHWTGSLEIGVSESRTLHAFPASLIDLGVWVWTGRSTFKNRELVTDAMHYSTDNLKQGAKVGLMLTDQGVAGYFDGINMGVLFPEVSRDLFPIINLYGKCAEVTLAGGKKLSYSISEEDVSSDELLELAACAALKRNCQFFYPTVGDFSFFNGRRVVLRHSERSPSVIFGAKPLKVGEIFELLINETLVDCGSVCVGLLSAANVNLGTVAENVRSQEDIKRYQSCLLTGSGVWIDGVKVRDCFCPELYSLDYDDRIGVRLGNDESVAFMCNGDTLHRVCGAFSLSDPSCFFISMGDRVRSVEVVDNAARMIDPSPHRSFGENSMIFMERNLHTPGCVARIPSSCHLSSVSCGKNVRVTEDGLSAFRVRGYNQAVVISNNPLVRNMLFQVRVNSLDGKWKGSLSIGVTGQDHAGVDLPADAAKLPTWLIRDDSVLFNGVKIRGRYFRGIGSASVGHVIGILADTHGNLHLYVDGEDQGVAATDLPRTLYAVIDLYGSCNEVEVVEEIEKTSVDCCQISSGVRNTTNVNYIHPFLPIACQFFHLCERYLGTLGLPSEFFSGSASCFCSACLKCIDEPFDGRREEYPHKFAKPNGWCKFALCTHPNVDFASVSKHWDLAFCGTDRAEARKMLDSGGIPTNRSSAFDLRSKNFGPHLRRRVLTGVSLNKSMDDQLDVNPLFLDKYSMIRYKPSLAFQVYVPPLALKPKSDLPALETPKANSSLDKEELAAHEPGTTLLSHFLIKLEEVYF